MPRRAPLRPVRWGRLREIRHVQAVPGVSFSKLPNRLKHLTAWRRMHMAGGHKPVRKFGTSIGVRPSSNTTLRQKKRFIKKTFGK